MHPEWLAKYQPLAPLPVLVEQVNRIFHSFDAGRYDREHAEIRELWPGLWDKMISILPPGRRWRVLDFGCGTGFEVNHLLHSKTGESVSFVLAFDPSSEMLSVASEQVRSDRVVFTADLSQAAEHGPFNLLLTNSVLHHLPDVQAALDSLMPLLSADAIWLSGNEPSARYYRNPECLRLFQQYAAHLERAKWITPSRYLAKLKSMMGRDSLSRTAAHAQAAGLFAARPHPDVIAKLVDFHVPYSGNFEQQAGFDLASLQTALSSNWRLGWSTSYSFLGAFSEMHASGDWLLRARKLQQLYPDDGANFCAVWYRV